MSQWGLIAVFIIYGGSFLVMAWVLWQHIRRTAGVGVTSRLNFLALFALTHGLSDLMDAALRFPGVDPDPSGPAAVIRLTLLVVSFLFLLLFGLVVTVDDVGLQRVIIGFGTLAVAGMVAGLAALFLADSTADSFAATEKATRLLVGLPGAALSAVALVRISRICSRLGLHHCATGARVAAFGMAAYGILAGGVATGYPQAVMVLGLPIQLHRMAAAVVLTVGCVWMLQKLEYDRE